MSEFREDPTSGDWTIIAPGRAARPAFLSAKRVPRVPTPKTGCPFEHPEKNGNWPPLSAYPAEKNWRIIVLPNKYPAVTHGDNCSTPFIDGPYRGMTGIGIHELVITRDHYKNFAELDKKTAVEVFRVIQGRCAAAAKDHCLSYVVPFFNWGLKAGASVFHPHYQILGLPIVPSHNSRSLRGAQGYFKKHRRCVRCDVIKIERAKGVRVIAENRNAIAISPYASRIPFEVRIMPKKHLPFFHKTGDETLADVAVLLQTVMGRLKKYVNDPDLNFFIHEAPIDGENHAYHHWHVEILPRVSTLAGFEFSTGICINVVDPESATKILQGKTKAKNGYH